MVSPFILELPYILQCVLRPSELVYLVHGVDESRGEDHQDEAGEELEDDPVEPHVDSEQNVGPRKLCNLKQSGCKIF